MKRFFLLQLSFLFFISTSVFAQDSTALQELQKKLGQNTNQNTDHTSPLAMPLAQPTSVKETSPSRVEGMIKKFSEDDRFQFTPGGQLVSKEKQQANDRMDKDEVKDKIKDENKDENKENLKQFGYDFFKKPLEAIPANVAVSPDYRLGPGDRFTLTLWGLIEGIYTLDVSKEGAVTLPKAGVVAVAGVKFEDLDEVLRKNLEKYYKDFNLSVAMANVKSISIYVTGEVNKPGRYAVSSLATLLDALVMAGGPTKQGSLRNIQVKRGSVTKNVDLYDFFITGKQDDDIKLEAGDSLFVSVIGNVVAVSGNVTRPAIYEVKESENLGDVLDLAGGILSVGSLHRIQVQRIESHQKRVIVDVQATPAMLRDKKGLNVAMNSMDVVRVLPIYSEIWNKVSVVGTVQHPGDYELKPGMKLRSILNKDQLTPETYLDRVEVVRTNPETLERQVIAVNLRNLLKGEPSENISLKGRDVIYVFTEDRGEYRVTLKGAVKRPGEYVVKNGEKLASLLKRAGGFTSDAYPQGVAFTRTSVMDQQKAGLDKSLQQLELNMVRREANRMPGLSAETATIQKGESENIKTLIDKIREVKPEGRVVINLNPDLEKFENAPDNITLNDKDYIEIPRRPDTIIVLGSVFNPSAITWQPNKTAASYLKEVGGLTKFASKKEVTIFKMNGKVLSRRYYDINNQKLEPGDVINVPDKIRKPGQALFTLKDLTQIIFNLGTTTALFLAAF